ncbi:ExbD/TolR family protein [Peijinzhouia sedimentorum]
MDFKSKYKVDSAFSMSSMTDIIFLLLIFFMLTASFVTPSGLPVSLPSSQASTIVMQKVSVTITKDLEYYLNDRKININDLERELGKELLGKEGVVVLHADKSVPVEHVVRIAGIATSLEAKVTLATRPE